jgi:serine/threonine protein phosphatase 1
MSIIKTPRTFVMGDIHGAYLALIQCLKAVNFDYEQDTLIQLGDIADGWPQVPEIVEELLKIKNLISLRGNHDAWLEEWLELGVTTRLHFDQGGEASLEAYINKRLDGDFNEENHLNFFKKQRNYYIDNENRLFLHAGYTSKLGVGHEDRQSNYYWDRSLWTASMSVHTGTLSKTKMYKEVFIGHTTTMMWNIVYPMNKGNVWNLDTGAGFSGKLTIMDVNTKEYWQSDFVKTLYPNLHGR